MRDGVARIGVLVASEDREQLPTEGALVVIDLGPRQHLEVIAARLYAAMRALDHAGVDVILALDIEARDGLAAAIRDRLTRAAAGRLVHV